MDTQDNEAKEIAALEAEIVFYREHATDAVLELGHRLLVLLATLGETGFVDSLWRLRVPYDEARYLMAAAAKFASPASAPLLKLPYLSQPQLLELLTLDREEIAALAQGRRVRGLKYRDVVRMTPELLRLALRSGHQPTVNTLTATVR